MNLVMLWDAAKHVFHAISCLPYEAHETKTLPRLVSSVRTRIQRLSGDWGFSSRDNVQHLVNQGIEPVIRPQESVTPRARGSPA